MEYIQGLFFNSDYYFHYGCEIILAILIATLIAGYIGAPFYIWTLILGITLLSVGAPFWALIIFLLIAIVFNIKPLRAVLVSSSLLKVMKKIVPRISDTERIALDAGAVWVEAELFSGHPNFPKMLSEPYGQLTEEERDFLEGPVNKLCGMVNDWELWQKKEIPQQVWDYMRNEKFFGMIIPKEYGGLGFSAMCHSEVIQTLASRSAATCITVMVPNSLGPAELLSHYGTDKQKKHWLPRLATGEEMPCFALTEPEAGSDAGSMQSYGIVFRDDDGELKIRLYWEKRYITLAAVATVLGMAFRLRDPDNLLGQGEERGITCALISAEAEGVVLGRRHDPLGVPFYNCPTKGDGVVISVNDIIGGVEMAGQGWMMLMESLAAGRGISLPSQSTGSLKLATRVTSNYGVIRRQFGLSIGKFEGIEEPMARIAGFNYMLDAMRCFTCGAIDKGVKPPVITAIAKLNSTEIFRRCINDALDIVGGAGISLGRRNLLGHSYIAAPIGITVEGANILTRTLIIFGQGALRAHPYAYQEVSAIEKGDLKAFDRAFWGHVGHVIKNSFRSVILSLTRGCIARSPVSGELARYYRKLAWASASFAIMSDIAMGSLGGALKLKEKLTGRFADILSHMYMGFATLKRYEEEGQRKEDLPFVHYTLQYNFSEIQKSFEGVFENLSVPGLTWLFRGPILFWARLNRFSSLPSDKLSHKIASIVQKDSDQRDHMTKGLYLPKDPEEAMGRLEKAFKLIHKTAATEKKVKKAIRSKQLPKTKRIGDILDEAKNKSIVTDQEYNDLKEVIAIRRDAIEVDSYTLEEYLN